MNSISTVWDSLTDSDFGDAIVGALSLTGVLWLLTDIAVRLLNSRLKGNKQTYSGLSRVLLFSGVTGRFKWSHGKKRDSLKIEKYTERNKTSRAFARGAAMLIAILEAGFIFLSAPITRNITQKSTVGSELVARVTYKQKYRPVFPEPCSIEDYVETRTGGESAKLVTCLTTSVQAISGGTDLNGTFEFSFVGFGTFAIATATMTEFRYQFQAVVYVVQPDGRQLFKNFGSGTFLDGATLNAQFDIRREKSIPSYIPRPAEIENGMFYLFKYGDFSDTPVRTRFQTYTMAQVFFMLRWMIAERDGVQGHFIADVTGKNSTFVAMEDDIWIAKITRPIVPTLVALIMLAGAIVVWVIVVWLFDSPISIDGPVKEILGRLCGDSLGTGPDQVIERLISWNRYSGVAHEGWIVPEGNQLDGIEEASVLKGVSKLL